MRKPVSRIHIVFIGIRIQLLTLLGFWVRLALDRGPDPVGYIRRTRIKPPKCNILTQNASV